MIHWKIGLRHQDPEMAKRARNLRKQMTDAEKYFWRQLRDRRFIETKFRRQVPFGPYILDFYCAQNRIAVELDGGQHFSAQRRTKDFKKDRFLRSRGIRTIRYSDREVLLDSEAVMQHLWKVLRDEQSSPQPSPFQGSSLHTTKRAQTIK